MGQGSRLIWWLMVINVGLVAVQALSAGLFLSGYRHSVTVHSGGAMALQVGALVQAIAAVVLWRRRRAPAWVASASAVLFVMVLLQAGLGFRKTYWLHVPIGVLLFGGLMRQVDRLDTPNRSRAREQTESLNGN